MILTTTIMVNKQKVFKYLNAHKYEIISWSILIIVLIVIVYLGVTLHNKFSPSHDTSLTSTVMNDSTMYLLFSVVALIITQIANPIHQKRYKRTINYMQTIDENFTKHAQDIITRVSNTEATIKFYIVERNISTSLHKIIVDSIAYLPTKESNGILDIGNTITNFALNIHDFGVHNYNKKQLCINVLQLNSTNNQVVANKYPAIADVVIPLLNDKTVEYKLKIENIAGDNVLNSKMDRFRTLSEMFLQEYLSIVIIHYLKAKNN